MLTQFHEQPYRNLMKRICSADSAGHYSKCGNSAGFDSLSLGRMTIRPGESRVDGKVHKEKGRRPKTPERLEDCNTPNDESDSGSF